MDHEHQPVRRPKLRKGTFSCRECKIRKKRCQLVPASKTCANCQRRGLNCVGQDVEDEETPRSPTDLQQRLSHVEGLITRVLVQSERMNAQPSPLASRFGTSLSAHLSAVLPPVETMLDILHRGRSPFDVYWKSGHLQARTRLASASSHPICFAKTLLELATCLQQLDSESANPVDRMLLQPSSRSAQHFADIARHLTAQDDMVRSVDGLRALLLQGRYNVQMHRVQSAWLCFRRACSIAQLMRLCDNFDATDTHARQVHFRAVHSDRFASLLLELPCVEYSTDDEQLGISMAREQPEIAMERLERSHVYVAGRVISRKASFQRQLESGRFTSVYSADSEAHQLQVKLLQAARPFPLAWWTVPGHSESMSTETAVQLPTRMSAHIHHHHLILLIHLPYILWEFVCSSAQQSNGYSYSTSAALCASREILSRVHLLHLLKPSPASMAGLNHKAYVAAISLVLVHIHGYKLGSLNTLEHQRASDLLLVQQVIEVTRVPRVPTEAEPGPCADFEAVQRLLHLEERAASRVKFDLNIGPEVAVLGESCELAFSLPYCSNFQMTSTESVGLRNFVPDFGQENMFVESESRIANELPLAVADDAMFLLSEGLDLEYALGHANTPDNTGSRIEYQHIMNEFID